MMENIGTGVMELLVARAVQICCQVCHGVLLHSAPLGMGKAH